MTTLSMATANSNIEKSASQLANLQQDNIEETIKLLETKIDEYRKRCKDALTNEEFRACHFRLEQFENNHTTLLQKKLKNDKDNTTNTRHKNPDTNDQGYTKEEIDYLKTLIPDIEEPVFIDGLKI